MKIVCRTCKTCDFITYAYLGNTEYSCSYSRASLVNVSHLVLMRDLALFTGPYLDYCHLEQLSYTVSAIELSRNEAMRNVFMLCYFDKSTEEDRYWEQRGGGVICLKFNMHNISNIPIAFIGQIMPTSRQNMPVCMHNMPTCKHYMPTCKHNMPTCKHYMHAQYIIMQVQHAYGRSGIQQQ